MSTQPTPSWSDVLAQVKCDTCAARLIGPPHSWQSYMFQMADGTKRTWLVPLAQLVVRVLTEYLVFPAGSPVGPYTLTSDQVAELAATIQVDSAHLDHIPESALDEPGIMIAIPDASSPIGHSNILIDGSHRMARAMRDGKPFRCYILSEKESALCEVQSFDQEHFADMIRAIRGVPEAMRKYQ